MTRTEKFVYCVLVTVGVASVVVFLGWWFEPGHVPGNFHGSAHVLDVVLFLLLTSVFAHRMFMDGFVWAAAAGMWHRLDDAPAPEAGYRVAFITTFVPSSEPISLLLKALPAMLEADYLHDVWVLDEGGDPEVRSLCESMGVRYFSRHGVRKYNLVAGPYTARTKGGNHNAWYAEHGADYDFVAQIDTDFVPRHDFLTRTLGYFRDERIGFVGTPQVYGNLGQSIVARGAAQQLFMFYGAIMRGLAGRGSANMIGANHVVRVSALREIDFYAGHLTEDLLTGMRLHAAGWKSRYVREPLAVGEGPATWHSYFQQQMRWAFGCMDILRRYSFELTRRMPLRQRVLYLALQQHYFAGVACIVGLALLCGYFFGGVTPADVPVVATLIWIAPVVILRQVIAFWLQRFSPSPGSDRGLLWAGRYTSIVVWPIYLLAAVGVLRQKRLEFAVTPKGAGQDDTEPLQVAVPHLAVVVISVAALTTGLLTGRTAIPMIGWAVLNAALMGSFVVVVVRGRLRGATRRVRLGLASRVASARGPRGLLIESRSGRR